MSLAEPSKSCSTMARFAMFFARSPIRSRSVEILIAEMASRRSVATGWRSAMRRTACSSISLSIWSMRLSSRTVRSASSPSRRPTASMAAASCASVSPPIWAMRAASPSSSSWNDLTIRCVTACSPVHSTEAAGDVVLRALVTRIGEDALCLAFLDKLAEMKESRALRDARCLLHRMRYDDDGIIPPQLIHQFFDLRGRNGIKRRAGLVHEDHFRLHGDGAGDAKPLLLAA